MKRLAAGILFAVGGVALAVGMSVAAYAIAGRDLSRPARPVRVSVNLAPARASSERLSPKPSPKPSAHETSKTEDRSGSTGSGSTGSVSTPDRSDSHGGSDSSGGSGDSDSGGSDDGSHGGPDD
jgi:hypothetical protein